MSDQTAEISALRARIDTLESINKALADSLISILPKLAMMDAIGLNIALEVGANNDAGMKEWLSKFEDSRNDFVQEIQTLAEIFDHE